MIIVFILVRLTTDICIQPSYYIYFEFFLKVKRIFKHIFLSFLLCCGYLFFICILHEGWRIHNFFMMHICPCRRCQCRVDVVLLLWC